MKPAPSSAASGEKQAWLVLLLIVALAAFLRFHMLGVRSLWPAECFSVLLAWQPFPRFLRTLWWGEANMAFYYLLMRGWVLLGDSEFWVQSLSALFGVLAIPAVYALGKRFLSREVGLIAAALLAVHSSHIEHSEQLRSYSLWVLLAILVTHSFLSLLEAPQRKALWLLYIVLALVFIYTQVFAIFLLAAQWLAVGPRKVFALGLWKVLATFAAIGLLSTPMAIVMLFRDSGQLDWIPPVSLPGLWEVFRSIVGTDSLGSREFAATVVLSALYVVAWILALTGLFYSGSARINEPRARTAVTVLLWSLIFPLAAMIAVSFRRPIVYPRYLLMSVPAAVLLAGQGLAILAKLVPRGRLVSSAALVVMVALAFLGVHKLHTHLDTSGNDWRGVCNYILQRKEPGDAVIFYNFSGGWAFDYYARLYQERGGQGPAPPVLFPLTFERSSIERRTAPYRRVWVALQQALPTPKSIENDEILRQTLRQGRFHLAQETPFAGERLFPNEDVSIDLTLYTTVP